MIYIQEHYLMQKYIRQRENTKGKEREERRKKKEERKEKKLVTQERAKKTRERITRGESPSPRPVKQRATKGSQ